ncbi:phage tail assembly protein [Moraxella nonliquefaciens]|uniref:phage tail assembly protein n=1 Tax=Moraxella nonliquefaciens TaxID=478 RepID=UPI003EE14E10
MRRAKVGDLRTVGQMKNEMEQELALFARLTSLVPEDLDLLDQVDYKQIQDTFRKFSEL